MTKLQATVLEAIPFAEDSALGYMDQAITLSGIKDFYNPRRDDIILQVSDNELKTAIRFLIRNGFVQYRGNVGPHRQARYTRLK